VNKHLIWLCLVVLGSSATAQRFSASLQFSSGGAFSNAAALTQFEVSYNPMPELTIGTKIGLQNAPLGSVVVFQLNPYAYYRLLVASSETWFLTGFAGVNINFNYAPSGSTITAAAQSANPVLRPQKDGVDDDDLIVNPIPNVSALGFRITTLFGLDGAWFIDEKNSVYLGLETDLVLPPNFGISVYPYLEYDYQALDNLTIAVGGYLNFGALFAYNVYVYGFYNLTSSSALRLELNWNGQFGVALRWTLKS
jgi:hypothetical protein